MAGLIGLPPQTLDISLYAGDGFSFKVICTDNAEPPAPINITGTVEAQIRLDRVTVDPAITEFAVDLAEKAQGIIILSLTGAQTQELMAAGGKPDKFSGVWDLQWTPTGSEPRTLCQGKVDCVIDVTR